MSVVKIPFDLARANKGAQVVSGPTDTKCEILLVLPDRSPAERLLVRVLRPNGNPAVVRFYSEKGESKDAYPLELLVRKQFKG